MSTMTKTKNDLVDAISDKAGITKIQAGQAIDAFTQTVTATLASGEEVSLIGFGKFCTTIRAERQGINPSTRAPITIAEARVAKFKVGQKLKDAVNCK